MGEQAQTANDRLKIIDKVLDEYENSVGLPEYKPPGGEEELQTYLSMSRDSIEKLTASDCAEIGMRLSQYAFHVQRSLNRENSRTVWAESLLDDVVAGEINNYDKFVKFEIKVAHITKQNSYANAIRRIMVYAKQRSERLKFLANSIIHVRESIVNVQRAKVIKTNE